MFSSNPSNISACHCHPDYSTHQTCDKNNGSCTCKHPIIPLADRTCGRCIRGYGDFPNCKGKIHTSITFTILI